APDVILVSGNSGMAPLHRATRTVPIVFVNTSDPVGGGFATSLGASWRECDGIFQHRIRHERKMARVAQADFARRHPRGGPPRIRASRPGAGSWARSRPWGRS